MKTKTNNVFILMLSLVGLTALGWYFKHQYRPEKMAVTTMENTHNQTVSHNDLAEALKQASNTNDQLSSKINNLNVEMAELRKNALSHANTPNDTEEKIHKLNQEMQALHQQLKTLSSNMTVSNNNLPEAIPKQEEVTFKADEREAELARNTEQQINLYNNAAIQEGVDQGWATQAQTKVYDSFQALSADGVEVSEVACHRSFCQAKIGLSSDNNHMAIRKLQASSPWKGESFIWIKDIEQGEGVIYLAREGQTLPNE